MMVRPTTCRTEISQYVSEPGAVATGSLVIATRQKSPVATAPGSDTQSKPTKIDNRQLKI